MRRIIESEFEKRYFPRLKEPAFFCAPRFFGPRERVYNISLGGLRVHSDNHFKKGKRLDIEIFLSNERSIVAAARVVWIKELPPGSDIIYDVGLEFVSLPPYAFQLLKSEIVRGSFIE